MRASGGIPRAPTQSVRVDGDGDDLEGDLEEERTSYPSLAVGTHGDENTRAESPAAQRRTPPPPEAAAGADGKKPPKLPREDPELRLGATLGAYRLVQLLGKGGMGYVYRAEHVKLGREVALKLLRSDYAKRRDAVARFFQEARTVNRVRHRNIVDVTDFVELDDGTTYIIMELLAGTSLGKWSRTDVDLPRALAVLAQICDGLGAAHAVGVVHRDLKPDNVMIIASPEGGEHVKLLDFGVAKLVHADDEFSGVETAAGSVIGTPAYMSPEQAGGMLVDHRSDIYSLGAIMYELFTGQAMFRGRSFGEYVRKHLTEAPPAPRATVGGKDLDPRIEALILRCLEKDPARRFAHILELRDGLLELTASDVHAAATVIKPHRPPRRPATPLPLPPPPDGANEARAAKSVAGAPVYTARESKLPTQTVRPPRLWPWMLAAGAAIVLGGGAAIWHGRASSGDAPRAQVTAPVVGSTLPVVPLAGSAVVVAPAPTPTPTAPAARLIDVRIDSLPSASVFSDGHAAEQCKTPCSLSLNLADGGPTDRREFVLRAPGYQDKRVAIDLGAAAPEAHVTLAAIAQTPTPTPSAQNRGHGRPVVVAKPAVVAPPTDTKPTEPKPQPKRPTSDTIDQSETIDPFHPR